MVRQRITFEVNVKWKTSATVNGHAFLKCLLFFLTLFNAYHVRTCTNNMHVRIGGSAVSLNAKKAVYYVS